MPGGFPDFFFREFVDRIPGRFPGNSWRDKRFPKESSKEFPECTPGGFLQEFFERNSEVNREKNLKTTLEGNQRK